MTSIQYEELCRWFIAGQLKIPVEQVRSVRIPNPEREHRETLIKLVPFQHQIDLYWETANAELRYINIANAKWRSRDPVHQHDVLLLQQVKLKVGAHKAILITNSSFTAHAEQAAWDEGIGLLLLRPALANTVESRTLHCDNPTGPAIFNCWRSFVLPEGGVAIPGAWRAAGWQGYRPRRALRAPSSCQSA